MHNELLNVWTHTLGMLIVIIFAIYVGECIHELTGLESKIHNDINKIFNT